MLEDFETQGGKALERGKGRGIHISDPTNRDGMSSMILREDLGGGCHHLPLFRCCHQASYLSIILKGSDDAQTHILMSVSANDAETVIWHIQPVLMAFLMQERFVWMGVLFSCF